jgi:putative ABC transport system substrate-binding protein
VRRREFIAGALLGAVAARARAQQAAKAYRIAIVHESLPVTELTETSIRASWRAFFEELRRLGYVEGRNIVVERYSGGGLADRYPELAREVVRTNPDVIYASSSRLALSFKAATSTIPLVVFSGDPVAYGIVSSLARPGGNITGLTLYAGTGILGKRLELLHEVVPGASKVANLVSEAEWEGPYTAATREFAQRLGLSLVGPPLAAPFTEAEYRRVFAAMTQQGADALLVGDQAENFTNRQLIVELAGKAGLPALYGTREYVELGGLMTYAADQRDLNRKIADHIDLILRGAAPGDIPFYQPTKFELMVNLRAARALGLTIPDSLLVRADEVIE